MIRISIYNENLHEINSEAIRKVYPNGIHGALKEALTADDTSVRTFTLDTVNDITDEVLQNTDVMLWWGHMAHDKVPDEVAQRVRDAVLKGMGIIFLHSGHLAKPFKLLTGTANTLTWRENDERELVWVVNPAHPIAKGLGRFIVIDHDETYGEPFGIPEPDELVFIGSYEGGEVFRSGCCFYRGLGRVFYFQPGHETHPVYYLPGVIQVLKNAVRWALPVARIDKLECPNVGKPLEK